MNVTLITPEDLQKLSEDISKHLSRLEDKINSASTQAKYADLKTITKLLGYTSTQRMRAFIETAIEEGHTIRMIKPKINRYDNKLLGDTIERVGRDTKRKLSENDRFVGAIRLCLKKLSVTRLCWKIWRRSLESYMLH